MRECGRGDVGRERERGKGGRKIWGGREEIRGGEEGGKEVGNVLQFLPAVQFSLVLASTTFPVSHTGKTVVPTTQLTHIQLKMSTVRVTSMTFNLNSGTHHKQSIVLPMLFVPL